MPMANRMVIDSSARLALAAALLVAACGLADCHGRMLDPPQRGSMWRFGFDVPPNYDDMSNYCGGFVHQWEKNNGKCGVCGDPYDAHPKDHEPGGIYATGIIGKTYYEGQRINITIDITANHYGYFEFRLCRNDEPLKTVEQECFDENLLLVYNNNEHVIPPKKAKALNKDLNKYKYFVPYKNNTKFYVSAQLPHGVTCSACVLQWRYHAGNNFGTSLNGKAACLGCAEKQEEFFNCADVQILSGNNRDYSFDANDHGNGTNETSSSGAPGPGLALVAGLPLWWLLRLALCLLCALGLVL